MGKLDGEGGIVVSEPIQVYNAGGSVAEGSGREITTRGLGMSAGGPIVGDFTSIIIPLSLCGSKNNVNRKVGGACPGWLVGWLDSWVGGWAAGAAPCLAWMPAACKRSWS